MRPIVMTARSVYARPPADGPAHACSGMHCGWLTPAIYLLWMGAMVIVALAMLQYVRRARTECDEERGRLVAEREAFRRFARRVSDLSPTRDIAKTDGGVRPLAGASETDEALDEVRRAYRETVMSVAHYESDYGEPLAQNMCAELGENVATAVTDGGTFTPQLKAALVQKSVEASERRSAVLEDIDQETERLDEAAADLESVIDDLRDLDETPLPERGFDELARTHEELEELEAKTEDILADHQDVIAGRERVDAEDAAHDFHDYLYDPLDASYPVLTDGARVIDQIRTARSRVVAALSRRV